MISAALLSRPGQSETVSWQAGCTAKTPSTEGLFDSFLRRAGRAHSRKEPKSRLTMTGILQVRRDAVFCNRFMRWHYWQNPGNAARDETPRDSTVDLFAFAKYCCAWMNL